MQETNHIACPLCNDKVDRLLFRFHIDSERHVLENIKKQNPEWTEKDGVCSRCLDYYQVEVLSQHRLIPDIGLHFSVKSVDDFVILPTPVRVDADPRFTGKGTTICFIDSGFYRHPDLVSNKNRIKIIVDVADNFRELEPEEHSLQNMAWHGTMTSVVCAGNGSLSQGLYKGIASEAELVLLKVQDNLGRIHTKSIIDALAWVKRNHKQFGIRIVNLSVAANETQSHEIDQLAAELNEEGVILVAAVGNNENAELKSPANSPHVIAIGGIDDHNLLDDGGLGLYHSSFGKSDFGFQKPELVSNAIWLAAPILPETREKMEAEALHTLLRANTENFLDEFSIANKRFHWNLGIRNNLEETVAVAFIKDKILSTKFFSDSYMHVDGTSFAAPIVCSIIAQMLEVKPSLTPTEIRTILFKTAKRIPSLPIERQGFGYVRPRAAVLQLLKDQPVLRNGKSPYVNKVNHCVEFYLQHSYAEQVSVCGNFNNWQPGVLLMEPGQNNLWKLEIPLLPAGVYAYKFVIDERDWIEDIENPQRAPDGLNGWNSILEVESD